MHASAEAIANPFDSFLHNDRRIPVLTETSQDWTKMLKDSEQMKFLFKKNAVMFWYNWWYEVMDTSALSLWLNSRNNWGYTENQNWVFLYGRGFRMLKKKKKNLHIASASLLRMWLNCFEKVCIAIIKWVQTLTNKGEMHFSRRMRKGKLWLERVRNWGSEYFPQ